jgi:hypothetical protein
MVSEAQGKVIRFVNGEIAEVLNAGMGLEMSLLYVVRRTGFSKSTVYRTLEKLVNAGVLFKKTRPNKRGLPVNMYCTGDFHVARSETVEDFWKYCYWYREDEKSLSLFEANVLIYKFVNENVCKFYEGEGVLND